MKVGIISDTHDHHKNVLKAVEIFKEQGVKYIFHAGDIVSPFTAKAFGEAKDAKFIGVFGNCDGEKKLIKSTIVEFGGEIHDKLYAGIVEGRKILMTHKPEKIDEVINSGNYDLVIYGHTHQPDMRRVDDTLVINPGEATDWITGKSYVVILELDDMSYEQIPLM